LITSIKVNLFLLKSGSNPALSGTKTHLFTADFALK